MSTTAGWSDVMFSSIKSTDIDYVAGNNRNAFWNLYFILFLIIGFFFFLNLFIGVVVTNFNTEKDKIGGNHLLTEQQREWIELKLLVLRCAPIQKFKAPDNKFLLFFFKISESKYFDNLVFWCILINSIILMFTFYGQPEELTSALEILNYIFTAFFVLEALIKIIGLGPRVYIKDEWNIFSFLIALVSAIGILISAYNPSAIKGSITFLRSFRILRILRLLKNGGRSLHMIFNTFVITFQQLVNIGSLLMILIYMYSVLGMILFGMTARKGIMNAQINFENFFNAFLTLFTVTTADSWNAIQSTFAFEDSIKTQCKTDATYQDYIEAGNITVGCGNSGYAIFYFTSYFFIVCLIFLQLFIAIILQGYDQTQIQEARLFNDTLTHHFRKTWAEFDPDATTFISLYQLRLFLSKLGSPLGFDPSFKGNRLLQDKFIALMDLPTYYDFSKYQFLDVLEALSFRVTIINKEQENAINRGISGIVDLANFEPNSLKALQVKGQISKEINTLIQQQKDDEMSGLQEAIEKEMKNRRMKDKRTDQVDLTSVHHIAAEATIRRLKRVLARRRRAEQTINRELIPKNVSILKKNKSVQNLTQKTFFDELNIKTKAPKNKVNENFQKEIQQKNQMVKKNDNSELKNVSEIRNQQTKNAID